MTEKWRKDGMEQGKEELSDVVTLLKVEFDEEVSDGKLLRLIQNSIDKITDVLQIGGIKQCFLPPDYDHSRSPNTTEQSFSAAATEDNTLAGLRSTAGFNYDEVLAQKLRKYDTIAVRIVLRTFS